MGLVFDLKTDDLAFHCRKSQPVAARAARVAPASRLLADDDLVSAALRQRVVRQSFVRRRIIRQSCIRQRISRNRGFFVG